MLSPVKNKKQKNLFDNSNRLARIWYRLSAYRHIFAAAVLKGVPPKELLISKFPTKFKDAKLPPVLSVELSTYCNLRCPYCTNPLARRKRNFMEFSLAEKITAEMKQLKTRRLQLVGNGEPTLHPEFGKIISMFGKAASYMSIVTNGQWLREETADELVNSGMSLVEFSIDAGGKEGYEKSRIGGSFDALLQNIRRLRQLRDKAKSRLKINVRVMFRPSVIHTMDEELAFWRKEADMVMPQYLVRINGTDYEEDLFIPQQQKAGAFPKCSLPFYHSEIKYNGNILMCYYSAFQLGEPGLLLGNVNDTPIYDLWNHEILQQYRKAHRERNNAMMPVCQGCPGT